MYSYEQYELHLFEQSIASEIGLAYTSRPALGGRGARLVAGRSKPNESEAAPTAARGQRSGSRQSLAVALAPALAPLVELALEAGITSPEFERVVRSVFVDRASALLCASNRRQSGVSDLRIGLTIGVPRNAVRQIRSTRREVQLAKIQRRHRGDALLKAWTTDWIYLTEAGLPRDLPIHAVGGQPSFANLVRAHLRGVSTGTALAELRRSGAVRLLPDEIVRLRSRTVRPLGISQASIAAAAERLQALASTELHNLKAPDAARFCESLEPISVTADEARIIRQTLVRRARGFLDSLASELANEAPKSTGEARTRIGLTVFSHETELPAISATQYRGRQP